jgi:hypothetical protein
LGDACGQIVHQWTDHPIARPGAVVHLLEDGSIIRAKTDLNHQLEPTFGGGGSGGTIEIVDWDGNVTWRYVIADSLRRAHHDIHVLPNGNILVTAWERKSLGEIVMMGFDTVNLIHEGLWSESIFEINPQNDSIVWEWHVWDHLVQDFDPSKPNFGNIKDEYDRIHINYHEYSPSNIKDWLHINAIDYFPDLDQIMLCVRNFNEVWIIDHSTSVEEAAGSTGGNSNKGGDILFRWGNPEAYQSGTKEDRVFWQQHDAHWIQDFALKGTELYGKMCVFNNYIERESSLGQVISPLFDTTTHTYVQDSSGRFLPRAESASYTHPDAFLSLSALASSIQFLPNENVLMCAAQKGFMYELTQTGEIVWEYRTPLFFGNPVSQGTQLSISQNFTNQVRRYGPDFEGLLDRDLSPKGFLELNPNTEFCTVNIAIEFVNNPLVVFPNPAQHVLNIQNQPDKTIQYKIYSTTGIQMAEGVLPASYSSTREIDIAHLKNGYYILHINGQVVKFLVL